MIVKVGDNYGASKKNAIEYTKISRFLSHLVRFIYNVMNDLAYDWPLMFRFVLFKNLFQ